MHVWVGATAHRMVVHMFPLVCAAVQQKEDIDLGVAVQQSEYMNLGVAGGCERDWVWFVTILTGALAVEYGGCGLEVGARLASEDEAGC